ncbi:hypothetical protein C4K05_4176 [Pseudomonas chlororaphis subsp. aureofaciens]|nr:hypothetical protein C4K12_4134 [Pseudomonas chlororaphis subsp. aureofaciens]AZE24593.1 hypothetical protein C4K08_4174 [Pseudomonas chlororaphis subsp. aureofaciens]AZE43508.1 hypothetical protein C4K05_4176 [Pseudomonas chlororaphis subsp. aureofaciens]
MMNSLFKRPADPSISDKSFFLIGRQDLRYSCFEFARIFT